MNSLNLVTRHYGRPLLMTADAARILADRALNVDPRAFARPSSRFLAKPAEWLRKAGVISGADKPKAEQAESVRPEIFAPIYAEPPEAIGFGWSLVEGIACIDINGPLMDRGFESCGEWFHGYDTLAMAVQESSADARVKATFIRISSPGGVASGGLPELAALIRNSRASAGGKPIWAFCDQACSAAYWIAAQADRVIAPSVGIIGSIGAVIVHEDCSEMLAQAGIKVTALQFGANKTDGAEFKPLSPEALAHIQALVDECGRNFVRDVHAGRPQLSEAEQIATQATVYMAQHAEPGRSGLSLKLCDAIMSEQVAFRALQASLNGAPANPSNPGARAAAVSDAGQIAASKPPLENSMNKVKAEDAAAEGGGGADETVQKIADICAGGEIDSDQKLILIRGILEEEAPAPAAEPAPAEPAPAAQSEADRAKAILSLPEAKANPALANALAFTAKSVDDAKVALKAAAGDRAALKLAAIPDPSLGGAPDAEAATKSDDKKAAEFIRASAAAANGGRRRGKL